MVDGGVVDVEERRESKDKDGRLSLRGNFPLV